MYFHVFGALVIIHTINDLNLYHEYNFYSKSNREGGGELAISCDGNRIVGRFNWFSFPSLTRLICFFLLFFFSFFPSLKL